MSSVIRNVLIGQVKKLKMADNTVQRDSIKSSVEHSSIN